MGCGMGTSTGALLFGDYTLWWCIAFGRSIRAYAAAAIIPGLTMAPRDVRSLFWLPSQTRRLHRHPSRRTLARTNILRQAPPPTPLKPRTDRLFRRQKLPRSMRWTSGQLRPHGSCARHRNMTITYRPTWNPRPLLKVFRMSRPVRSHMRIARLNLGPRR